MKEPKASGAKIPRVIFRAREGRRPGLPRPAARLEDEATPTPRATQASTELGVP